MNKLISQKIYFFSFFCMVLLLFIHGFNVTNFPLFATSTIAEPLTITNSIEYFFANGLFRFRLPMLMMISGYLIAYKADTSYIALIKKKLKTLMLPYVLFSFIAIIIIALAETILIPNNIDGFWGKRVASYTLYDWFYRMIISPIPFQLWFLRVLFVFMLAYPILKYCLQKAATPCLLTLFLLRVGFNSIHYTLIFYFATGIYLQLQAINITTKPSFFNIKLWLLIVIILITLKTLIAYNGKPYFGKYTTIVLQGIHILHVIPTILLVWFGLDKLVFYCLKQKWFTAFAGASFFIFAAHEPLMVMLIKPYVSALGNGEAAKLIAFFTLPIIMLAFCIALNAVVEKLSPKLHNILTGSRGQIKRA